MRILLTGGGGFLGAWIASRLTRGNVEVRVFERHDDRTLARTIVGEAADRLDWRVGDIVDTGAVAAAAEGCDGIVHLAGVLTPACKDDPLAGARINVLGTLNVFEAARAHGIRQVVYTSSGGVYGPDDRAEPFPTTHYGAFKLANEGNARAYWEDAGIASIGFRPFVVYGPGRVGGLTAGPTLACRAAAHGEPYVIPFTGSAGMVYVDDVAAAYEAASRTELAGAHTMNLTGQVATMDEVAADIRRIVPGADIRVDGPALPSGAGAANEWGNGVLPLGRERTLDEGLAETVEFYQRTPD
jgi:nucleoside-diphosphate-sugar epimerase